ncbi:WD40-repeat-containing domain protein [Biscogniauxia marginata]|nr:WD40-repeat-containing domain protein [Biscogniauxia marginata]
MGGQEIPEIVKDCQTAIASLFTATKDYDSRVKDIVNERDVQQIQERFDQWAGNLGALQSTKSRLSLEHRLRNSPFTKNAIRKMLMDLHDSVQTAADIAVGKRSNRTAGPIIGSGTNLAEYDISSSDSDSAISSTSSIGNYTQAAGLTSEIQELMSAIKLGLDNLFKASVFIRKFAPKEKRQRASNTKPFDNRADVMHIKDRYPVVTKKNVALVTRLGEANARRRQYFKYRRDHNDRLSRPDTEGDVSESGSKLHLQSRPVDKSSKLTKSISSEQTKPSLLAETEATELVVDPLAEVQLSSLLDAPSAQSVVSFATSVIESSEDNLSFPPLPAEAQNNYSFLCPYCMMVVPLGRKDKDRQWRKHIVEDLEPYICTFPGCTLDSYQSQHAWFEHELLVHRNDWVCPNCAGVFESPEALEEHINKRHSQEISGKHIKTVIEQSRRPKESIQPSECPLCDDEWALAEPSVISAEEVLVVDPDQFRQHLGHHLQQVALFSLPRLNQEQEVDSNHAGGLPDRDAMPASYMWVRDDCGRGWTIISRRRATFITFAFFLAKRHMVKLPRSRRIENNALGDPDENRLPSHARKNRDDWSVIFNQAVPRVLDVDLVHTVVHETTVWCVCFSHDGKYVATGSNRLAQIYDVKTGEEVCAFALQEENDVSVDNYKRLYIMYIRSVCFSPDSKYLAIGGDDKLVWEIQSRTIRNTFAHEGMVTSLDFTCDGRTIASGSYDYTVRLWDVESSKVRLALTAGSIVQAVAISPNSKYVAAGSYHGVRVWDSHHGYLLANFEDPDNLTNRVGAIAFSPNSKYLVGGNNGNTIKMWELPSSEDEGGRCVKSFEGDMVRFLA